MVWCWLGSVHPYPDETSRMLGNWMCVMEMSLVTCRIVVCMATSVWWLWYRRGGEHTGVGDARRGRLHAPRVRGSDLRGRAVPVAAAASVPPLQGSLPHHATHLWTQGMNSTVTCDIIYLRTYIHSQYAGWTTRNVYGTHWEYITSTVNYPLKDTTRTPNLFHYQRLELLSYCY